MRFGLIGAGCIGQIRARALANHEICSLAAIADMEPARARAIASTKDIAVFADYRDLLSRSDLQAVIVSTPPQYHEEIVTAALQSGKHVICEKPLANTVEACRRMVDASRNSRMTLATGFNHRYFPAVQFVKQAIESDAIGELDHVRAFGGHTGLSEFRNSWEHDKNIMGGGALMDVGIHVIDLTRYLLGEIEEVFGAATSNIWKLGQSEDNGMALLRSSRGKYATLHATWTEWKGYGFHIEAYGTKGMVRASYAPMMSMGIYLDKPGGRRRRTFNFYPTLMLREKVRGWQSTVIQTFRQEFTDFVNVTNGKRGNMADGVAGLRAVEIADAVYQSTRERRPICLKPLS
jgi:predicted dehydrogenase